MIKVGQTWKTRDGREFIIEEKKADVDSLWPFRAKDASWTKEGRWYSGREDHRLDLITLVKDVPKMENVVSIDWTKPIQTRDGLGKAELIAVLNDPRLNHVVKITREGKHDCIQLVTVEGKLGNEREQAHMNIINVPPPPPKTYTAFVVLWSNMSGGVRRTREEAESYRRIYENADYKCLGIVEVSITEGEGLYAKS